MTFFSRSLIVGFLTLSGCASTPDPTFYLLPIPETSETVPFSGGTIAVRELALPLYARAQQVASLSEDGSVFLSDDHRWADEPSRATTRTFVSVLKQNTGAPIVAEPWPSSVNPAVRVDITVDRFIGDLRGGTLEFSGQYRLVRPGNENAQQDSFSYRLPIDGTGYKSLAAAHSNAIKTLAEDIATQISGSGS